MSLRILLPSLALAFAVSACSDALSPPDQSLASDAQGDPMAGLLSAARAQVPIDNSRGITINIPDQTLGKTSAEVLFYNDLVYERYRFARTGDRWTRGAMVASGAVEPISTRGNDREALAGYSSSIATLRDKNNSVRDSDWYIINVTQTGTVYREEEYQTNLPYTGTFDAGTQQYGDTTYAVAFHGPWQKWRFNAPTGNQSGSCGSGTCDLRFQYDSLGFIAYVGAEKAGVTGYLTVTRPVTNVQISGPTSIAGASGNRQWSASAQGGDGVTMSYTWESSPSGTGSWTQVGTGSTYTKNIGSGDSNTVFYLRVTATSNGKSGQSSAFQVTVGQVSEPLDASVSGTNAILSSGNYTWNASVQGGITPYSYLWEFCNGSCTSVGTGTSYSRYVTLGDGDFTLKLTVTDSGSGAGQQQDIVWHSVYVSPDGGGTLSTQTDTIR